MDFNWNLLGRKWYRWPPTASGASLFPLWDALRIVPIRSETIAPLPAIRPHACSQAACGLPVNAKVLFFLKCGDVMMLPSPVQVPIASREELCR